MTKPTTTTPEPKRASPIPTAETLAIRALRDLRKLDARLAKAEQEVTDLKGERKELLAALPDEATRILKTLQPSTTSGDQ
jgi:hypothetical protein